MPTQENPLTAVEDKTIHELAESRLAAYSFLRAALNKPTPDQHAWMQRPEFQHALNVLCDEFAVPYLDEEAIPGEYVDFESRYLACFEVGLPAPPVPLQASCYNRREPIPAVIHEHVLFYKRFGLHLRDDENESADHLLNELAFLLHLDELLLTGKMAADSLVLARRDFLKRHMTRWLPRAAVDAEKNCLPAIYRTLLDLLVRAVDQDMKLTDGFVAHQAKEQP
jgi:DMSO reductase family type II enzyme chaperone